ncbi:uncharacterized protein LOC108676934 [Hyalella azteca]|uniref:Uncharacterized protein LOC108676934 n=1 Tax=Hyalella azteca TaxID=294128 RepID=A0A8B7P657_HYAAZ|nr:uncharacterized protein LOC108676934 [Hyalella azteca]
MITFLQADVLESSQCDLVTSVRDCRDYEQLQCLVASSLASLSSRCFLNHRLVSKCLSLLFSLCHRLCDLLSDASVANSAAVGAARGAAGGAASGAALQELSSELSSCCSRLFLVLSSMQQLPGQHHTASLLDRLDYNLHYRREQQQRGIAEDSSEASTSLYSNIQT